MKTMSEKTPKGYGHRAIMQTSRGSYQVTLPKALVTKAGYDIDIEQFYVMYYPEDRSIRLLPEMKY